MLHQIFKESKNLLVVKASAADLRGARQVARMRRSLAIEAGDQDVAQEWRVMAMHLGQLLDTPGEV